MTLAARRAEALQRVTNDIRQAGGVAFSIVTDLADDDSLANLVARNPSEFDILVNNAGYTVWKSLEATTMARWPIGPALSTHELQALRSRDRTPFPVPAHQFVHAVLIGRSAIAGFHPRRSGRAPLGHPAPLEGPMVIQTSCTRLDG